MRSLQSWDSEKRFDALPEGKPASRSRRDGFKKDETSASGDHHVAESKPKTSTSTDSPKAQRTNGASEHGPAPTWEDIVAMETASTKEALKIADRIVQHPDAVYHHNVFKGGTRAIVEGGHFIPGDGTASFGGARSVRAYIGQVNPAAAKIAKHPIIEFSVPSERPKTRLYQGRVGAYWETLTPVPVKVQKVYLTDGRIAVPNGNGFLRVTNLDGTHGRMSIKELPE